MKYPGGKTFAFSVIDDTDVSTVENIKPIYDLLETLGFRTSKTAWMKKCVGRSKNFYRSQTMEEPDYAEYVHSLKEKGFEICFHGASMESSPRELILDALEKFREHFGEYPRIHCNHAENRDNLYWGEERFNTPAIRLAYKLTHFSNRHYFSGHDPESDFFWGDACRNHIKYIRNFCYDEVNVFKINPSMPYRNPRCAFSNLWFSATDTPDVTHFNALLTEENLRRLEQEGGICLVATHFGKNFVVDGKVDEQASRVFRYLAGRPGWFVPVSTILDYLYENGLRGSISKKEIWNMEHRWIRYKIRSAIVDRLHRRTA